MDISVVQHTAGAHRRRKRVGRGEASGRGRTSGRGNKGAGQRAGWRQRLLSEGGAFPLFRRVAKRGFSNINFETRYQVVNVGDLASAFEAGAHVTAASLCEKRLIRDAKAPVKVLGDGELPHKLSVEAQRFSAEAARKIEAAGGVVTRLGPQPKKKFVKRPPPPKPAEAPAEKGGEGAKAKGKKKAPPGEGEKHAGGPPKEKKPKGGDEKSEG